MEGKEVSYSRQWDGLFGDAPLKAPLPQLDTKQCLPSPSMKLQAAEKGATRVPFTEDVWVLPKLRNWLFREPWSFYDVMVSGRGRQSGCRLGWLEASAAAAAAGRRGDSSPPRICAASALVRSSCACNCRFCLPVPGSFGAVAVQAH